MRWTWALCCFGVLIVGCQSVDQQEASPPTDSVPVRLEEPTEVAHWTRLIAADPNNAELYYQRHKVYLSLNNLKAAFRDLSFAIGLDSSNLAYYDAMAELALQAGHVDAGIQAYQQLLERDPKNLTGLLKLSKVYFLEKEHANSMLLLSRAEALAPTNAEIWFIRGLNLKEMKDTVRAIAAFQKAVSLKTDFYDAYIQLGLLNSSKPSQLAAQYFDQAIRLDSFAAEAYYNKGKFYLDRGERALKNNRWEESLENFERAKSIYQQLIRLNPQHEFALFNLGFIYMRQDSGDKAYRLFDMAIKMNPTYAEAYYYRGLLSLERGQREQAEADFRQCLVLKPDFERAREELKNLPN